MLDAALVHPKEATLKPLVFGIGVLTWGLVACTVIGLCYGLMLIPFVLIAHAVFLGHVRGTGVRVDANQLPELHRRVVGAAQRLGLTSVPEVYVVQSGGTLNAFATKLLSRTYVVLFSELLDKCNRDEEVDFVVAHELAHHAAGHLKWMLLTAPARAVPLLGPAYSRACEYTCDRAALATTQSLEHGQRALAVLAAGSKAGAQLDLGAFAAQQTSAGEFWPAVAELSSSHPYLPKRVAMLAEWHAEQSGTVRLAPAPGRPFFSYVLAFFMGRQALGILFVAYVVGIFAAIAVPNFLKAQERLKAAAAGARPPETRPDAAPSFAPAAGESEGVEPEEAEADPTGDEDVVEAPDEGREAPASGEPSAVPARRTDGPAPGGRPRVR